MDTLTLTYDLQEKLDTLKDILKKMGSVAVGFSGGVDSSLLISVACDVLKDKAIAVINDDASVPEREISFAKNFCDEKGIELVICHVNPLEDESYRHNSPDRCYYCKRGIFSAVKKVAEERSLAYACEGSNMDDLGDYRPGLKAVEELSVRSPLREAKLYKHEIRIISKALGLPTWSKPAYACLASRFVYGEEITKEKLHMIELAEQYLIELGFFEERVRLHGNLARIEVPGKDISRIASDDLREKIYDEFRRLGFMYVTLDLKGYKTGSMNLTLEK